MSFYKALWCQWSVCFAPQAVRCQNVRSKYLDMGGMQRKASVCFEESFLCEIWQPGLSQYARAER